MLFPAIVTQLLHAALLVALAPLLGGLVRWLKARLLGRRGPHPLQPWRDLRKLLRKEPVLAEGASLVTVAAPYAALAATFLAALTVPGFAHGMALAPLGDLVLIGGLLALARAALALAGMDSGTALGGLGAARATAYACFAWPAFLLAGMVLAMLAGTTNVDGIGTALQEGAAGLRLSLGLALLALLAVALTDGGRLPADDPASQPEPSMVQEAMLLEASGRHLALWEMHGALRLTLWLGLLAALFLPFGTAPAEAGPLGWLLGLLAWALKLGLLAAALAVFETAIARMRVFRVPEFLGAALLLALLGVVLLFLSTGLA